MSPAGDLAPWHEFYTLLGTAAGTLVALLFVAASVASGVFSSDRRAPLRIFYSATVVHFSSVLVMSLILLTPIQNWIALGTMVLVGALVGIAYCGLVWRDVTRDGRLAAAIDLEDRVWYAVLPVVTYLCELTAGVLLAAQRAEGCAVLAVSLTLLLVAGIRNAWDITVWTITRRRE
jgi:hypothetical protein